MLFTRQNKNLLSPSVCGLMVEPGSNIYSATLLPILENEYPNPAVALRMFFNLGMQILLHTVEEQWLDLARLGADL
jgi:hypothetical protein